MSVNNERKTFFDFQHHLNSRAWSLCPTATHNFLSSRLFFPSQSFLIATAASKIVRIALHRCGRFATQALCVGARDPFCGWDWQTAVCVSVAGRPRHSRFRQDLRGCPRPVRLLDGAWSSWGPWTACSQIVSTGREQQCRCRLRSCSQPPPMLGGHTCRGPSIQVRPGSDWCLRTPWFLFFFVQCWAFFSKVNR